MGRFVVLCVSVLCQYSNFNRNINVQCIRLSIQQKKNTFFCQDDNISFDNLITRLKNLLSSISMEDYFFSLDTDNQTRNSDLFLLQDSNHQVRTKSVDVDNNKIISSFFVFMNLYSL